MANYSFAEISDKHIYFKVMIHNLTDEQKDQIKQYSDARRFIYNYYLNDANERYEATGERFRGYKKLTTDLTNLKKKEGFEWLNQYPVSILRGGIRDLNRGFMRFKRKQCRHPRFKSKKKDRIRFEVRSDRVHIFAESGRCLYLPGISKDHSDLLDIGTHHIPFGKDIEYGESHIVFDGFDYWFTTSIKPKIPFYEDDDYPIILEGEPIGIDLGIRVAATLSNGKQFYGPDLYRLGVLFNRKSKVGAAIGRDRHRRIKESMRTKTKYDDIPKSKNELKREKKYLKTLKQISNIYKTRYQQIASAISHEHHSVVTLETLRIKQMQKSTKVPGPVYESRLYMFGQILENKLKNSGSIVIRAEDGFKSSQICSCCGNVYNPGAERVYRCRVCGNEMDRDLNAAINLRNYGIEYLSKNPYRGYSAIGAL